MIKDMSHSLGRFKTKEGKDLGFGAHCGFDLSLGTVRELVGEGSTSDPRSHTFAASHIIG